MKTKEELNALKEEVEAVNEKLAELTPEEIAQVSGGLTNSPLYYGCNSNDFVAKNSAYTGNPICTFCKHFVNGTCAKDHDNLVQGVSCAGGW